jgi:hypothetical protein
MPTKARTSKAAPSTSTVASDAGTGREPAWRTAGPEIRAALDAAIDSGAKLQPIHLGLAAGVLDRDSDALRRDDERGGFVSTMRALARLDALRMVSDKLLVWQEVHLTLGSHPAPPAQAPAPADV